MYFLGIDAGGTKCRARLVNAKGDILGHGLSGPANVRVGGVEKRSLAIIDAFE